ncbi:MAG TPA: 16S rRNA (uracil(1498)-N(3))-methyltransferase [Pyrinomonadaceae bacterium]|nr:16S rRNA (uracil(1498)-N(3))-methyltransferase [Pyrinomonadaceae bacterium]
MTRRRFYAPRESFADDGATLFLSEEETRHLRDVLRLRAGDEAFVFDGAGAEFRCVVADAGGRGRDGRARLEVRGRVESAVPESPLALTLCAALLKGEKFDLVVQKATELGVVRVVPVETKRAEVRPRNSSDAREATGRLERWRRLALEAAKQSGRARLPEISEPRTLSSLLADIHAEEEQGDHARLLFAERGGGSLAEALGGRCALAAVTALVGPEGGWEDAEIEAGREHGWSIVTLGGRTLRAETACIAVTVLLQHLCGDLK